jgi:hypothetical protein
MNLILIFRMIFVLMAGLTLGRSGYLFALLYFSLSLSVFLVSPPSNIDCRRSTLIRCFLCISGEDAEEADLQRDDTRTRRSGEQASVVLPPQSRCRPAAPHLLAHQSSLTISVDIVESSFMSTFSKLSSNSNTNLIKLHSRIYAK